MVPVILFTMLTLTALLPSFFLVEKNLARTGRWAQLDRWIAQELSLQKGSFQRIQMENLLLKSLRGSCSTLIATPPALAAAQATARGIEAVQEIEKLKIEFSRKYMLQKGFLGNEKNVFLRRPATNACQLPEDLKFVHDAQGNILTFVHVRDFAGGQVYLESSATNPSPQWRYFFPRRLPR